MPQGEHIELHRKRYGRRLDHEERTRKKEARSVKKRAAMAQRALGIKGKMFAKERAKEKATMRKTIAMHEEKDRKHKADDGQKGAAMPAYLLEREQASREGGAAPPGPPGCTPPAPGCVQRVGASGSAGQCCLATSLLCRTRRPGARPCATHHNTSNCLWWRRPQTLRRTATDRRLSQLMRC